MSWLLLVPVLLRRRWGSVVCNVRTWVSDGVPGGIEFDEDEGELRDDAGEVVSSENEDTVLFSVGVGEEDQAEDEDNLGKSHLINMRSKISVQRVKI